MHELEAFIPLAADLGVNAVNFGLLWVQNEWCRLNNPTGEEERAIIQSVRKARDKGRNLGIQVKSGYLDLKAPEKPRSFRTFADLCQAPWRNMNITFDGRIIVCCNIGGQVFGNLNDATAEKIWKGEEYEKCRKGLLENKPYGNCARCKILFPNSEKAYLKGEFLKKSPESEPNDHKGGDIS
jgi:radical SAM protein with 4Fe4S-binding SPASM domain